MLIQVEGFAKHLRCVAIDAASPHSKKPESRELIDRANREKRVLLTWNAKLLRYEYILKNQIYRVTSLLLNEQLLEVIETFQLKVSEDQLMSRCTRCIGTTEEAVEAAKGFQRIPNCLFDKNLEFSQCMDCNHLFWEGTQYHNAVQKFIDVCKLNSILVMHWRVSGLFVVTHKLVCSTYFVEPADMVDVLPVNHIMRSLEIPSFPNSSPTQNNFRCL